MNNQLRIIFSSLLMMVACFYLNGQDLAGSKGPQDSTHFLLNGYPNLAPPATIDGLTPYYKVFYLSGDGEYRMDTIMNGGSDEYNHRYPEYILATTTIPIAPTAARMASTYRPRVYAISTYSNGAPPPDRINAGPVGNGTDKTTFPDGVIPKTLVEDSEFLKIFPHADAKKGEPLVYIINFKNPQDDTSLNNGTLFLLYNGNIREIRTRSDGSTRSRETGKQASFSVEDVLIHSSRIDDGVFEFSTQMNPELLNLYEKTMAFSVGGLQPGEEGRVFVEFTVDSINYDHFNGKNRAEVDFTAILVSHDSDNNQTDLLTPEERKYVDSLGFDFAIDRANDSIPDLLYRYLQQTDTTLTTTQGIDNGVLAGFGNILDVSTHTVSLVKEHDPNYLLVDACPCPNNNERKKLFFTVHAENDGLAPVTSAYFDIELPATIDADDVIGTPISYHPYNAALNTDTTIHFTRLDDRNIRWTFTNQFLRSVQEFGVGDPRTFVEVQFMAFTDAESSSLDSILHACIRFNDLANDAFCTYPVPVNLISGEDKALAKLLECTTCAEDTKEVGIPCWIWMTILFFILLILTVWLNHHYQE